MPGINSKQTHQHLHSFWDRQVLCNLKYLNSNLIEDDSPWTYNLWKGDPSIPHLFIDLFIGQRQNIFHTYIFATVIHFSCNHYTNHNIVFILISFSHVCIKSVLEIIPRPIPHNKTSYHINPFSWYSQYCQQKKTTDWGYKKETHRSVTDWLSLVSVLWLSKVLS